MKKIILIGMFVSHLSNALCLASPDGALIEYNFHELIAQCSPLKKNATSVKEESESCTRNMVDKFKLQSSIFEGNIVYGESVFIHSDNKENRYKLAFPPTEIVKIYNFYTEEIYVKGRDYIETKDGFKITAQSKIIPAPVNFDVNISDEEKTHFPVKLSTEYQNYQYGVTYKKNKKVPIKSVGNIDKLRVRIGKDLLRVTFYGDSITTGANATSIYTYPHQPGYVDLVMGYLSACFPHKWLWRNNAVGGWNTKNAVKALGYRVLTIPSDLYVIAFGMNDSAEDFTPEIYKNQVIRMVDKIKSNNSNASIMLIGSSRFNPKWNLPHNYFTEYVEMLKQIALDYKNVVYADVTGAWDYLMINKNYYDLTGNGLNHPNDFGHRVMAEVVLMALLGKQCQEQQFVSLLPDFYPGSTAPSS